MSTMRRASGARSSGASTSTPQRVWPDSSTSPRRRALVTNACNVRWLVLDSGRDALHGLLDDAIDNRLLKRVIINGPGEETALLVGPRGEFARGEDQSLPSQHPGEQSHSARMRSP